MFAKPTIRKVTNEDIQTIVDIHREIVSIVNAKMYPDTVIKEWLKDITIENVKSQLKIETTAWYIMELEGIPIGFCQFPLDKNEIYQLNIKPEFQGQGYGKMLYEFIENKFREVKTEKIELFSTLNAREFYEKLGFVCLKEIKYKLLHAEMDMFLMEKKLN
jgi:ribosomal-protein-alanine N-acetyltransferase